MSNKVQKKEKKAKDAEDAPVVNFVECSPCRREERRVEATKFCQECDEHLCEKCIHDHQKFVVTKNHRITDKQLPPDEGPKPQLTDQCTNHTGKVLELYCSNHDELCCSVCVAVGHRGCEGVAYIPLAAAGIESSLELLEVKDSLIQVRSEVSKLKEKREENQHAVQQQKEDIISAVVDLRIRVSELLDRLERSTRTDLQGRYDDLIKLIDNDVRTCDDVIKTLTGLSTKVETTSNNDAELFINVKKSQKSINEAKAVIRNISKNVGKERLSFIVDRSLENLLTGLLLLGTFGEETHVFTAHFEGEHNISLSTDPGSSEENTGSASLPDGRVLLTATHHKRLKLLTPQYRVVDQCDLPGKPYDVCVATPTEAIVSLREEKLLQFVDIEKKLKLSRTIRVGVPCYGVTSANSEIFVACIGGQYENRPQIRVYNMSGRLLRVLEKDGEGQLIFASPRNLIVGMDGLVLHVTDRVNGVVTLTTSGKVTQTYKSSQLESPRGITRDASGNIFVVGQNSHNVLQFNPAGELVGVLLKDRARIYRPQSICYIQREHTACLLLTFLKSKFIKVFVLA